MWTQLEKGAALPTPTSQDIQALPYHSQQCFSLFPFLFMMELINYFPSKGDEGKEGLGRKQNSGKSPKITNLGTSRTEPPSLLLFHA